MNKDIKRYFKECQYLFAYCGKKEKKYLDKLLDNIDDGSHELNYDEIVKDWVHHKKLLWIIIIKKMYMN